jgi:hypothetical protein
VPGKDEAGRQTPGGGHKALLQNPILASSGCERRMVVSAFIASRFPHPYACITKTNCIGDSGL